MLFLVWCSDKPKYTGEGASGVEVKREAPGSTPEIKPKKKLSRAVTISIVAWGTNHATSDRGSTVFGDRKDDKRDDLANADAPRSAPNTSNRKSKESQFVAMALSNDHL